MGIHMNDDDDSSSPLTVKEAPSIQQPGMWGLILKSKGGPYEVRMTDDTGTPVNWIHPDLVKRFKLELESCETKTFKGMRGKPFKVKEFVWFTWVGRDQKTYSGTFYVAPRESNIDVMLGDEFVKANGRAHDVCAPEQVVKDARVFVTSTVKVSGRDAACRCKPCWADNANAMTGQGTQGD
jgi:hypothetical protein